MHKDQRPLRFGLVCISESSDDGEENCSQGLPVKYETGTVAGGENPTDPKPALRKLSYGENKADGDVKTIKIGNTICWY